VYSTRALASASVAVMRHIDQQWGVARALADLARLRHHPGEAHDRYVEALGILEEIGARPEIARCLAGLGRVAMDLGSLEQARRYLASARHLGESAVARLWAQGLALSSEAAVALAVDVRPSRPADSLTRALTVVGDGDETLPSPGPLARG
jgi:hypothetical protein